MPRASRRSRGGRRRRSGRRSSCASCRAGIAPPAGGAPVWLWVLWQVALFVVAAALLAPARSPGGARSRPGAGSAARRARAWRRRRRSPGRCCGPRRPGGRPGTRSSGRAPSRPSRSRAGTPRCCSSPRPRSPASAARRWCGAPRRGAAWSWRSATSVDSSPPTVRRCGSSSAWATCSPTRPRRRHPAGRSGGAALLRVYARSPLASAGSPVALAVWDGGAARPAARVATAEWRVDSAALAGVIAEARRTDAPRSGRSRPTWGPAVCLRHPARHGGR
jgi:hypothetical protein